MHKYRVVVALQELQNVEVQPRTRGAGQTQEYVVNNSRVLLVSQDIRHASTWLDKIHKMIVESQEFDCIDSKEEYQ